MSCYSEEQRNLLVMDVSLRVSVRRSLLRGYSVSLCSWRFLSASICDVVSVGLWRSSEKTFRRRSYVPYRYSAFWRTVPWSYPSVVEFGFLLWSSVRVPVEG
jgi:hypothetical protein